MSDNHYHNGGCGCGTIFVVAAFAYTLWCVFAEGATCFWAVWF